MKRTYFIKMPSTDEKVDMLLFYGEYSVICYYNGNFNMSLKRLAEFKPFLSEKIRHYGKICSGIMSYLSSQDTRIVYTNYNIVKVSKKYFDKR